MWKTQIEEKRQVNGERESQSDRETRGRDRMRRET